ncbi:undecaprenyl-diphosphate phosphatase [Sediminispirochaeta smaragdinae]|uniref:Undecaprenyl-diphosphatase n=1 Tax=Sediminispirochaeta smaragdinae (strain DSM 11293 / JCM 15392 / SEBR 4228) TaxID=573413 RepID=E1R855_SEDSS|nr:undecaprenyl-diphosphate phosphatase [Sediminispirochaeta smaragdinae]ADK82910.1 Bacitracin resistance protein BacA [Sediminispirochaeta smaragdinae DSM 11293]
MSMVQALFLGALQGVTEFLPVSSSGHLALMKYFMDLEDVPILFDVILHVATLFVVIWVFRAKVGRLFLALGHLITGKRDEEDNQNLHLILIILAATLVTGVLGLFLEGLDVGRFPRAVAALLVVTGLILLGAKRFSGNIGYEGLGLRHGLFTGLAQGLGVLPGISRSGITISAALASGMNRESAGEFSFLISLPAIAGALLLELRDVGSLLATVPPSSLIAGFLSAFIVGMASLVLLLRLIRRGKLYYFSFYLIPAGILGFILL